MFAFRFGCTASAARSETDQSMSARGRQSKAKTELSLSLSLQASVLELPGREGEIEANEKQGGMAFLSQVCNCSLREAKI